MANDLQRRSHAPLARAELSTEFRNVAVHSADVFRALTEFWDELLEVRGLLLKLGSLCLQRAVDDFDILNQRTAQVADAQLDRP